MRSVLTGGIKAILAVAVIATAIHWVLRLQREPDGLASPVVAALPDVETTGSIAPRETPAEVRQAALPSAAETRQAPAMPVAARAPAGLDQSALASLMATASAAPKVKAAAAPKPIAAAKIPVAAKVALAPKSPAPKSPAPKSLEAPKAAVVAKGPVVAKAPERPKALERARTAER